MKGSVLLRCSVLFASLALAPLLCAAPGDDGAAQEPLLPGPAPGKERAEGGAPSADDEAIAALVEASNAFGWRLHASLPPEGNALVCPFPALLELEKLRLAATGETRAEIDAAVPLPEAVEPRHFAELVARIANRRDDSGPERVESLRYRLLLASGTWIDDSLTLGKPFARRYAALTGRPVRRVDFGEPSRVAADVHGWLREALGAAAGEFDVSAIDYGAVHALGITELYVEGLWSMAFDFDPNSLREFRVSEGTVRRIPLMAKGGLMPYVEDERAQLVQTRAGGVFEWLVLLPRSEVSIHELERALSDGLFDDYRERLDDRAGWMHVPRFRMVAEADLRYGFRGLGVERAFDPARAEFADVGEPSFVLRLEQASWLEVDEEGICGGSSGRSLRAAGGTNQPPFEFIANRPFLFAVRHAPTGLILFSGRLWDPAGGCARSSESEGAAEPSQR